MTKPAVRIGIIGDFNPDFPSHVATDGALRHAAAALSVALETVWLPTASLEASEGDGRLERCHGLLATPGDYRSVDGALRAIAFARERDRPFLATCWGFQHVLLEYARNVVGIGDAIIRERDDTAGTPVVVRVTCPVPDRAPGAPALSGTLPIRIAPASKAFAIYGRSEVREPFFCNFELNPTYRASLEQGGLRVVGLDAEGRVRIVELPDRQFFLATLFQPQRASSAGTPHPVISACVLAAVRHMNGAGPS